MRKTLLAVSWKNTSEDARRSVEHFQYPSLIREKNISDLKHDARDYVKSLSNDAKAHDGHVDDRYIAQGTNLRERYEQLELIMNSLRHEFNDFVSKWM
jgi:hypothetical protein